MSTKPKYKENFPLFDELAPMIPEECREEVRKTMQLLENVWRDDLCKATIVMITKGKRKAYKKSRVMRTMFAKVITIIEGPSPDLSLTSTKLSTSAGRGVVTDNNKNR